MYGCLGISTPTFPVSSGGLHTTCVVDALETSDYSASLANLKAYAALILFIKRFFRLLSSVAVYYLGGETSSLNDKFYRFIISLMDFLSGYSKDTGTGIYCCCLYYCDPMSSIVRCTALSALLLFVI